MGRAFGVAGLVLVACLASRASATEEGGPSASDVAHSADLAVQEVEAEQFAAGDMPHGAATDVTVEAAEEDIEPIDQLRAMVSEGIEVSPWQGLDLRLFWKRGANYGVADEIRLFGRSGHLDGRIGLRFQLDGAGYVSRGIEEVHGGVDVRRLFFYTTGELDLAYPILFAIDLGIERGRFFVDDAYLWLTDLPWVGTLKLGQFTAPMGLAQLTGSGNRPFMETATPSESFAPGSKGGVQIANDAFDRRLTWQLGWFADTQSVPVGDASRSVNRIVARLTGLPIFDRWYARQNLLHLGVSSSVVFAGQERVRYQSRPESFLAPRIIDTGDVSADSAVLFGLEAAWVDGPLSLQSELMGSSVRSAEEGDPLFWGVYGEASWFLTGESRPFNRASAIFGRVLPRRPLYWGDWQTGAWEVAGRVSYTDLSEGRVDGGRVTTFMTGVNWYLNRYSRFLFEYGVSDVQGGPQDGTLHIFQTRFQIQI